MEGFFRLFRNHRAELAVLGVLILVAAVALPLLEGFLDRTTAELKVEALAAIENALERDIQYRSISPSIFLYLEVRDLTLTPRGGGAALRVSRLRVYYSLPRLLARRNVLSAVTRLDVRDSVLDLGTLDLSPASRASGGNRGSLSSPAAWMAALPASLQVTGTNLAVTFVDDGVRVSLERLFFRARRDADQIALQVTRVAVSVEHPQMDFRAQIRLNGRTSTDLARLDAVLRVDGFRSRSVALSRQSFQIQREGGSLTLRRIRDKAPIDLLLTLTGSRARLAVRTERYNPRTLVSFVGPLAFLNEYTRASVTTSSAVEYVIDQGRLTYEVDLTADVGGHILPPGTMVAATLRGDERLMRFDPLIVTSPKGDLRFEGDLNLADLLPQGLLRLTDVTAFAGKRVDADLDLKRGDRSVVLTGRRFEIGGTIFEDLRVAVTPRPGAFQFDVRAAVDGGSFGPRSVSAAGELRTGSRPSLELTAQAQALPLSLVARLSPLPTRTLARIEPALEGLVLDGDLLLHSDFLVATFESSRMVFTDAADRSNTATLSFRYDAGELHVDDLQIAWRGHKAAGSLALRQGPSSAAFSSSMLVDGLAYALEGTWEPSLGLLVSGSYGLRLGVHPLDGSYAVSFAARSLPLPLASPLAPVRLDVDLEGSWRGPGAWGAQVSRLALDGLPFGAGNASRIEASFAVEPQLLQVTRLRYHDRLGDLSSTRPATFVLADTVKGSIDLASQTTPERYTVTMELGPKTLSADLNLRDAPVARFGSGALTGNASGRITASGAYGDPSARLSVRLADAHLGGHPITLSVEATYAARRVAVTSLSAAMRPFHVDSAAGSYDAASGAFDAQATLVEDRFGVPIASRLSVSGRALPGTGMPLPQALFHGELQGLATVAPGPGRPDTSPSWTVAFALVGDLLRFDGGPEGSVHGSVAEDGGFDLTLARPLPVRGHVAGHLGANPTDTRIAGLEVDMRWLSTLVGNTFSFTSGTAFGVGDVVLSGDLADPLWRGSLEARNVQMGFYMSPLTTAPFRADLTLRDRDLVIEPTRAVVGPGQLVANGAIGFSHWVPTNYNLQFEGTSGGIHIVHDFGTVSVDGYATGILRVRGDDQAVRVTGDLSADYTKLAVSAAPETPKDQGSERTALFVDIQLTAGRRVEFFWPSISFPVLRASARTGSRLRIEHSGDQQQTRVTGRTALRGGDVFYINRSFYIKEGQLSFNETERRFDPRLTLRGEIRERDRTGQETKIYLVVDDRRLSEFAPRFESDPPKSDVEIVALLGGPIEDQLVQSGLAGSAVAVSGDLISHFGLLRPFEQGVRDLLSLDMFSIRTQMIQNVVVDRVLGIQPTLVDPATDPLGRYLDNTTVTFGKYIGKDLFLAMDVRISERQATGVDTEVLFSLDWPTPFFDLEWEMSPGGGDLETFVRDRTRLSVTWRYSY